MDFTGPETAILNRIQKNFPLTADPFSDMSRELSIRETELLSVLKNLKERGVVRNISGIFNADRLGYASTLVAFQVDERDIERAAAMINTHPGVSHNYRRDHRYNVWFTLASETEDMLLRTVKVLFDMTGAADHLVLGKEKLLKIGLMLPVGDGATPDAPIGSPASAEPSRAPVNLSDAEKEAVRLLQIDLPIERNPFMGLINAQGSPVRADYLLEQAHSLQAGGILRRYAAVLRHRSAGYTANAMTVWKPGWDADMNHIADTFCSQPLVSHLYIRTAYPGKWEYPLFAMIHARTENALNDIIQELSRRSGMDDYQVLRTVAEFKKERVHYFSPAFGAWERKVGL